MATDIGNQSVTVKFFDPINSTVVNRIALDTRKKGIYSGGYLTIVSDVSASLSALTCEIGDGTHQVRITTGVNVAVTVSTTLTTVILRWVYTGVAAADYMTLTAVAPGSVTANDIIVGVCTFSGATLTGFDYTLRTNPDVPSRFLQAVPTVAASMNVRVRAGRVNYGSVNYDIVDQLSPLFVAPVSGTRIDALQVNTSGALVVTQGTASPPAYGNLITIAQVTLTMGQTTITATSIKDVRNFISVAPSNPVLTTGNQTIDGIKTHTSFPVTPSSAPTTDYQVPNKKYVDDNSVLVAYEDGTIANGGTIPLIAGYTEGQSKWIVGMGVLDGRSASGDIDYINCHANGTRVVTCTGRSKNWVNSGVFTNLTGTANYLIVGVK